MRKRSGIMIAAILVWLLLPIQVFAVDFSITETTIDAYLQDDGDVHVTETFTYEFDGEFQGITRTIIPKEGTSIVDVSASEAGTRLDVELEDDTYRIYRSGEDETVTIDFAYVIQGGVDVYEDMAEFYWPFFDSNNESEYEKMTITVHPPNPTTEVIAFGYDEAFGTETIQDDGVVVFDLGLVERGKNGDIRVAYDRALFSAVDRILDGTIRNELLLENQNLKEKAALFLQRQAAWEHIALYVTSAYTLFLIGLLAFAWRRNRATKLEAENRHVSHSIIPEQVMSMPATVYYFCNEALDYGEMLTVGLMDLVRKGNVEGRDDETYRLVDRQTDHEHERKLLDLLFGKIGSGIEFTFKRMEIYAENDDHQEQLQEELAQYAKLIRQEIDAHQLFDKQLKLRWFTGLVSLLLVPLAIFLAIYELYMWLVISFALLLGLLTFAFLFKPRTIKGYLIKKEWKEFKERFLEMESNSWHTLSEADKERALIFSAGLNDEKLKGKNKTFIQTAGDEEEDGTLLFLLLMMSTTANSEFGSVVETFAHSSSSSSSGGTGVGGGGGGSGAF